jgi:hypothetical protein
MSSHVVSIRHELSLSVLRVIALSRITYKAMMQNLVLATACHSPYGWSLRALGNYSPDGHRCPRDEPAEFDRGVERAVPTSFQAWTLLTMVQLRGLVRITSGR